MSRPSFRSSTLYGYDSYRYRDHPRHRSSTRPADRPFVAGEISTIVDMTGYLTVQVAAGIDAPIPPACSHVARWHRDLSERPSTRA